ncbi:MAG: hypothetical protein F6K35_38460 [Okeania sp. SIO2H7]|nr:hypothetical protein [Okeania sp. SIO2H7]
MGQDFTMKTISQVPGISCPNFFNLKTFFLTLDKSKLRFDIPAMQYREQINGAIRDNLCCFDPNIDEIDVAFDRVTGLAASAYDSSRDLRITVSYTAAY